MSRGVKRSRSSTFGYGKGDIPLDRRSRKAKELAEIGEEAEHRAWKAIEELKQVMMLIGKFNRTIYWKEPKRRKGGHKL